MTSGSSIISCCVFSMDRSQKRSSDDNVIIIEKQFSIYIHVPRQDPIARNQMFMNELPTPISCAVKRGTLYPDIRGLGDPSRRCCGHKHRPGGPERQDES